MSVLPRPLDQLQLLLTERCNLSCTHCAVPEEDSPAPNELDTETWLGFVDEVMGAGVRRLVLSDWLVGSLIGAMVLAGALRILKLKP